MPIEAKEILEALDFGSEVTTIEQVRELHGKKFVPRATAWEDEEVRSKITGKVTGSIATLAKKNFGLTSDEIKDKKWEEIIELGASKLNKRLEDVTGESQKTKDQTVLDLEAKYEKAQKEKLEYKTAAETAANALKEKEELFGKEKKGWKVNSLLDTVKKDFEKELVSDVDPLKRKGFDSEIAEKYIFDIDDTGEALAVYDKEGKRIQDPKKLGTFISPKDLLISEATKHKLIKMNTGTTTTNVLKTFEKKEGQEQKKLGNLDPDKLPPATRKRLGL